MSTFDSPFPYFEYKKINLEEDKTDIKLELKTEYIEIKEENRDAYSIEDIQSKNNVLTRNNTTQFDVNIAEDFKKSDAPTTWRKEQKCSLCDFVTTSRYTFKRHIVNVHNTGAYECPNCDYRTHMKHNLKEHLKSKTQCQIRLARLKKLDGIDVPQEYCTKEESGFRCIYCEYNSKHKDALKKHVYRVHLQLKINSCLHCEFRTPYTRTLNSHMVRKHPEQCDPSQLEERACRFCGKIYSTIRSLRRHMQTEHLNEKMRCTLCEYTCIKNKEMVCHMKGYHKQKFECHNCGYTSHRKLALKEHILRKHLKLKEYTCDLCSFKTLYRKGLMAHTKAHDCSERLTCKYCSFITLNGKSLERHNRVQHNESSLKCDQCSYITYEKYRLAKHMDYKHNKIDYICEVCDSRFNSRGNLLIHMCKEHGEQLKSGNGYQESQYFDSDTGKVEETHDLTPMKLQTNECMGQIQEEIKIETVCVPSVVNHQDIPIKQEIESVPIKQEIETVPIKHEIETVYVPSLLDYHEDTVLE